MSIARTTSLAVAVLLVHTPVARAQDGAAEAFREALRLYEGEEYPEARAKFEEAYRIAPDVRVLANIADCFAHEGRPADAIRTYRRFLTEAGEEVPASARRLVERRLSELRPQVCDMTVVAEPAGATILVDDTEIGVAPMAAAWPVDAGARVVEVRFEGHRTVRRTVQARAGGDLEVAITLVPEGHEAATPAPPPEPEVPPPAEPPPVQHASTPLGRGPLVWVGAGVTVALAIAGTATGLIALSQQSEYEDPQTTPARRRALYEDRETMPLVADVLVDAAVVTGVLTLGLILFAGPGDDAAMSDEQALLTPRLGGREVGCDLHLAF